MTKYLLDTNICIYFLKGQFNLHQKIDEIGVENCFISEITVAELKYGVEKSLRKETNNKALNMFLAKFTILPLYTAIDVYAKEKARLSLRGKTLDDFDLLIGATAIANNLIIVTRNVSDFERMKDLKISDWTLQ